MLSQICTKIIRPCSYVREFWPAEKNIKPNPGAKAGRK